MFATALPSATTAPSPVPVHAAAAQHAANNAAADGPSSFASLLNQAEQAPAPDDDAPAAPAAPSSPNKAAAARGARPGPGMPPTDTPKKPATATPRDEDMPQDGPAGAALNSEDSAAKGKTSATDPSALLASLAAWAAPAVPPAPTTGAGGAGATARGMGVGAAALSAGKASGDSTRTSTTASAEAGAETSTGTRAQGFAGLVALAQAATQDSAGERGQGGGKSDTAAPLAETGSAGAAPWPGGLMATAASASPATAAPAEARLSASPGSAEFASQLGAQLSTFVREGVQHARLELHPVELGPVTVQIQLDGAAAQVDLAAQNADTRQALEQALPQLASSLREAGLTLSGGGVFEQPRQPQPDGDEGGANERGGVSRASAVGGSNTPEALAAPAAAVQRRRGVVDLVA